MKQATSAVIIASALIILLEVVVINFALNSLDNNYNYAEGNSQLALARSIARQLEVHMAGTYDMLIAMSNVPEIQEGSTEQCNNKLQELFAQLKLAPSTIARVNKEYVRDCATTRSVIGSSVKDYAYAQTIFSDPLHKPVLGRAFPSIVYENRYFVPLVVPIFGNKNFVGTLGSALYLDELKERYFGAGLDNNIQVIIIDDDNSILYAPNKNLIGKKSLSSDVVNYIGDSQEYENLQKEISGGGSGSAILAVNGTKRIDAYAPADIFVGRRWTVVVSTPVEDMRSASYTHQKSMRNMIYILALLVNALYVCAIICYFYLRKKKQLF